MPSRSKTRLDVATRLLDWMGREFRPFLVRPRSEGGVGWCSNDCIRTTKVALALLRRFHLQAHEVSLIAILQSPALRRAMREHNCTQVGQLPEAVRHALPSPAAIKMGRGLADNDRSPYLAPDGSWRGHLVAAVEQRYLLDLTLDVVNASGSDFAQKPVVIDLGIQEMRGFLAGTRGALVHSTDDGGQVEYHLDPENSAYRKLEAWLAWWGIHDRIIAKSHRAFLKGERPCL